jgi:TetR/AcrR family transcriptional repressor of nem operon
MRVSKEQKELTRKQIIEAAGRGFRQYGFAGLGIDGLAKQAGVTSGAFYGHFQSKDEVLHAATIAGLEDYKKNVIAYQKEYGQCWMEKFLDYYLGDTHCQNVAGGCIVPSLTGDISRGNQAVKASYEAHMAEVVEAMTEGLPHMNTSSVWALVSLLSGAVSMARAVDDVVVAKTILTSGRDAIERLILNS